MISATNFGTVPGGTVPSIIPNRNPFPIMNEFDSDIILLCLFYFH